MSDVSLVFNAVGRDRGVNSLLSRTASGVRSANVAGAASTVAFGAAMATAAASGVALGSSAMAVVSGVALIPGAIAAATAGVIAAKVAGFGLADAWKATGQAATSGGGAATSTARAVAAAHRQVRDATQALADAQRTALEAQQAISRAREEEAERLDDLHRSAAAAALDEEEAVAGVAKARADLAAAQRAGNSRDDIAAADLAYRRSLLTLDDVKDRVSDLGKEQDKAAKVGVDGSDLVQEAFKRQADAQRQVEQSAQRLADAQDAVRDASQKAASGGIDPAAEALAKLSPNGRAVILTLRALAVQWTAAARAGQQATFANVAGDLRRLSGTYLPSVTSWLVRMGGSFNTAIRQSMGLANTRSTVRDVNSILGNTATTTDRLARAIRPVVNGVMQFAAVGASFLPGLATDVGGIATSFERWAVAARESGKINEWTSRAVVILHQLAAIADNVVMSVVAIFHAGDDGDATISGLVRGSAAMRAWVESAQGQERISQVLTTLRGILTGLGQIIPVVASHGQEFSDGLNVTGQTVGFVAGHLDTLARWLPVVAAGYVAFKVAEMGSNVARVASLPIMAMQVAANRGLRAALNEHTIALQANTVATATGTGTKEASTVATVAGDVATKRSIFSLAAQKVAMVASATAAGIVTAAQWAWNAALYANPIGLIIIAVIALIGVIVLIATKTTWFQTAWNASWGAIKTAAHAVGSWFKDTLWGSWIKGAWDAMVNKGVSVVQWFAGLGGKLRNVLGNVATIISSPFRAGFNAIARFWNSTAGRLSFRLPSWVPGLGGLGFAMPHLPMLAKGGIVPATPGGMLAILGEGGQDEAVVPLPKGGSPAPSAPSAPGGNVRIIVVGGDREGLEWIRRLKAQGGF